MVNCIFFDLFNTLIDPHREIEHYEYDNLGISGETWGKCLWEREFTRKRESGILNTDEAVFSELGRLLTMDIRPEIRDRIVEARLRRLKLSLTDLRPGILETLGKLREMGLKLCVVSNTDIYDIRHWPESPLRAYFDAVVFSSDVKLVKPDAGIYRFALSRLQAEAAESLFVGDGGDSELMGAKALGFTTVMTEQILRRNEAQRTEILKFSDYRIDNLTELTGLVKNMAHGAFKS